MIKELAGPALRLGQAVIVALALTSLTACAGLNLFGKPKIEEEEIIPAEELYQSAIDDMDRQYFVTAIKTFAKLERQHPYSEYAEKAKLMTVYSNFRIGRYPEAILAADRYLALYPSSPEAAYVLYLKGTSYYGQIKDITRDQQLARDAIDVYVLMIDTYPQSKYVEDAREKMKLAIDQLAGKEMSVGRYYLGNGQYTAAINRFRVVIEKFQTTTHIEEALYRLVEANLKIGLLAEAQSAAAVLGHNYPSSEWYQKGFDLLQQHGGAPKLLEGDWLSQTVTG